MDFSERDRRLIIQKHALFQSVIQTVSFRLTHLITCLSMFLNADSNRRSYFIIFLVKGPAADATDAPQP